MRVCLRTWRSRRKLAPVPLCSSQTTYDLLWNRTRAASVVRRRLTAWAMTRPPIYLVQLLRIQMQFSRCCTMQLRGSGSTSGRDSGFCTTISHQDTHRLLCRNSSLSKTFLSSSKHRTLQISLRVTFGYSLFWKLVSKSYRIECDARIQEDSRGSLPSMLAATAGSTEQDRERERESECVCACVLVRARVRARIVLLNWLAKRCFASYHYIAIPPFREIFNSSLYTTFNFKLNCSLICIGRNIEIQRRNTYMLIYWTRKNLTSQIY
jgi:hypothetical protein